MTDHDTHATAVLRFWFVDGGAARDEWFRKDEAFDAAIRERFGALVEAAIDGAAAGWAARGAEAALAEIVLLDQFTRNIFRGSARAFAGDARALAAARALVDSGAHLALAPLQRVFAYLPFEHAEDLAAQRESQRLFGLLAAADAGLASYLDYAHRHAVVIERFGRFPHRNAALGRVSTPEETAYLAQPGSGF